MARSGKKEQEKIRSFRVIERICIVDSLAKSFCLLALIYIWKDFKNLQNQG